MQFAAVIALLCAGPALAQGERAGRFDYYVMALSWSPAWCATEGKGRGAPQCRERADFVLHGLWPQYERGYPSYCRTTQRDPSRVQSAAMVDVMGTEGAAWYQWKKHGRCSGLTAADYYALARRAYTRFAIPEVFRKLDRDVKLPASVVEEAFIEANPGLSRDMVTVTCDQGRIEEVRICLTRELTPRPCGADALRDCRMKDALMERP
ncbi:ribonuclease T2 family protein [Paenirhodobacter sp.]|uniref:ribonuclease T2 family protein n=1 Tax=Paenirhodobacter sp. TaxID=1965326 RepID=UPI003B411CD6